MLWAPVNLSVTVATTHGISPLAVAAVRWWSLAILFNLLLRVPLIERLTKVQWPSTRDAARAALVGALLFAPSHILYYLSLSQGASTTVCAVLGTTAPIWISALAYLLLRERSSRHRSAAIALGFVGAYLVAVGFALPTIEGKGLGNLIYLLGVIAESVTGVLSARWVRRSSGLGVLTWQITGASVAYIALALIQPWGLGWKFSPDITAGASLAYLTLVPGLMCFSVWYTLVEKVPLSLMVVTLLLQPPLVAFLGWLMLGEKLTVQLLIGGVFVFGALAIASTEKTQIVAAADAETIPS